MCISPLISFIVLLGFYLIDTPNAWFGWFGVLIVGSIYAGVIFPFYYELEDENLLIRFGCVRSRIPYHSIKKVTPTRNPISSPALSLDRLYVDTGNVLSVNISPADKSRFLKYLAEKVNHLVLLDNQLLPRNES